MTFLFKFLRLSEKVEILVQVVGQAVIPRNF